MRPSSRNYNPAPDLVLRKLILRRVFFSGAVFLFTDTGSEPPAVQVPLPPGEREHDGGRPGLHARPRGLPAGAARAVAGPARERGSPARRCRYDFYLVKRVMFQ